ncbi:MAG: tyrosine-type recombinase/integrase [Methylococcales bacterium]
MNERFVFTKKLIEALDIPTTGRAYAKDLKVPGLLIQITPTGTKSFQVFRRVNGKPVRVTLGRYPDLTIEQARRKALNVLSDLADGVNPNDEKKAERAKAVTLNEALEDYFKARPGLKATTTKDTRIAFAATFSDWLDKPICEISRDRVETRHRAFGKNRSEARANLAFRYLRSVLNFAIDRYRDSENNPILQSNPVSILKRSWFRVERRRTVLKPYEISPWWKAVENLPNRIAGDYFKLLILTGLRREEALSLVWADIDLKTRTLTVRNTKNRTDHTLPLTEYLLELFEQRCRESGNEFVFSGSRGRLSNLRYALDFVKSTSGVSFTPHDLRRTFATIADSLDTPGYALKALLNHKTGSDVTAGYVVVTPERLQEPMRKITDYVLKAAGVKESAEVIGLEPKRQHG